MMRDKILLLMYVFLFSIADAQVGIGTVTPSETLHISGTARIDNLTPNNLNSSKLIGIDASNVLNEVIVGTNLTLSGGVLSASSGGSSGATTMGITFINDNLANNTYNNYDLNLAGANADKTVFIFSQSTGSPQAFTITGISGGTDGRVIILKSNQSNLNINLYNEYFSSTPTNRIALGSNLSINGHGSFTLVYSSVKQRWVMIARTIP